MPARSRILSGAAACIPGILLLVFTTNGRVGITPDSVYYLAAAQSIVESGRLSTSAPAPSMQFAPDGTLVVEQPFVTWPPGYPAAIAALAAAGAPVRASAVLLNVCALAIVITCVAALGALMLDTEAAAWCAACAGVLPILQSVSRMAWSEPLFIALAAASIACVTSSIGDDAIRWRRWVLGGVFAGLATSVRYVGVAVFAFQALVMAWLMWNRRPTAQMVRAAAGIVAGPVVLALVLGWRALVLGCWACDARTIATSSPAANVRDLAYAGLSILPVVRAYPGLLDSIISAVVLAVLVAWIRAAQRSAVVRTSRLAVHMLITFAMVYSAMLVVLKSLTYFDSLDARLLSPAIVCVSAAALFILFDGSGRSARRYAPALLVYLVATTALDAASPSMRWRSIDDERVAGLPVMRAVPHVNTGTLLLSNDVPTIAWHTGRQVYWLPPPSMLAEVRKRYELLVLLRTDAPYDQAAIDALRSQATELESGDGFSLLRVTR